MGWDDANIWFNETNCKDSYELYQNECIIFGTFWQISCNYVMELVLSNVYDDILWKCNKIKKKWATFLLLFWYCGY